LIIRGARTTPRALRHPLIELRPKQVPLKCLDPLGALLVLLLNGREGHDLGWAGMASDANWQEPGQLSD
jgi:hypothetical protein